MTKIGYIPSHKVRIYIARHGQDLDNLNGILNGHRDAPLTERGIEQSLELANKMKKSCISLDKIYTSPLQRSYKTAELIANTLNLLKPEVMELLIERNFGVMTGKHIKAIREICTPNVLETQKMTYFLAPDEGETFPNVIERAKKVILEIERKHNTGNILLVTHGDVGKMIYAEYYHLTHDERWKEVLKSFHFGNSDLLLLSTDSRPEDAHIIRFKQYNL